MIDTVEIIGEGSVVQHGKVNDRVYLMSLKGDVFITIEKMQELARDHLYSKIFCKVRKAVAPVFFANGYLLEAYIPKFYNAEEDVFFVSKYLGSDRLLEIENEQLLVQSQLLLSTTAVASTPLDPAYSTRQLLPKDVEDITRIYRDVFESYPFPIHDPAYILKTMAENVQYFGAECEGCLVALASAEVDADGQNAEMTDFATHPTHHGHKLSIALLKILEEAMRTQGIKTLHTIARLNSVAMNKTFLRSGYEYSGTLIKNTNIAGKIESMNVYYKHV